MNRNDRLQAQQEAYLAWARNATTDEIPDDFGPCLPPEWLAASSANPMLMVAEGRDPAGDVHRYSFLTVERYSDGTWGWWDGNREHVAIGEPVQNDDGNWSWTDEANRWTVRAPTADELPLVKIDAGPGFH